MPWLTPACVSPQIFRAYERYGQEIGADVSEEGVKAAAVARSTAAAGGGNRGFAASQTHDGEDAHKTPQS